DLDVTVRDAKGGTDISWTGQLTFTPAVKVATAPHALPLPGATPVVDGKVDLAWALAPEIKTQTWIQGTSGATARVRAMWGKDTRYVLARVSDPTLSEESPDPWAQDSVEIFVDPENGKTKGYGDEDGQYRV